MIQETRVIENRMTLLEIKTNTVSVSLISLKGKSSIYFINAEGKINHVLYNISNPCKYNLSGSHVLFDSNEITSCVQNVCTSTSTIPLANLRHAPKWSIPRGKGLVESEFNPIWHGLCTLRFGPPTRKYLKLESWW